MNGIDPTMLIISEDFETTHVLAYGEVGPQGPRGIQGIPGDSAIDLCFQIINNFNEISEDENAKAAARSNLGLSTIDGGTFF